MKAITRGTRSPAQKQLARSVFLLVGVLIGLAVGAMFQAAVPVEYIKLISLIGIAAAALLLLYLLEALRP